MKKLLAVMMALSALSLSASASQQEISFSNSEMAAFSAVTPLDLINWKVGDEMSYEVSVGMFGKIGTMIKAVTKDEGTALWFKQDMTLQGRRELVEALIEKATGKILKLLRNGQEQQIPDDKMEIISQEYTEVTVKAGTFKALYIVAKTKDVSKIQLWMNPPETCMDGALKQIMATQFGDVTLELTEFKKAQ